MSNEEEDGPPGVILRPTTTCVRMTPAAVGSHLDHTLTSARVLKGRDGLQQLVHHPTRGRPEPGEGQPAARFVGVYAHWHTVLALSSIKASGTHPATPTDGDSLSAALTCKRRADHHPWQWPGPHHTTTSPPAPATAPAPRVRATIVILAQRTITPTITTTQPSKCPAAGPCRRRPRRGKACSRPWEAEGRAAAAR